MENVFSPYELNFDNQQRKKLLGETLKELRTEKGLTQTEVANLLEVKSQTYNGYENGKYEPNLETLVRLSFLFDCPIDVMLQKFNFIGTKEAQEEAFEKYKKELKELQEVAKTQPVNTELQSAMGLLNMMLKDITEAINGAQGQNKKAPTDSES